jgi:hypothetical protein
MISKERAEELRGKLILNLRNDLKDFFDWVIEESAKDPVNFLFDYISRIKMDYRASKGSSSSIGYETIDYPLNIMEFTEEELEYLKFYEAPFYHYRSPKENKNGDD